MASWGQRQTPDTIGRFEPLASELSKWPNARGFDEFYGTIQGHISYLRPKLGVPFVRQNEIIRQPPSGEFYATDMVTDEAIEMMRRAKEADAEAPSFCTLHTMRPITHLKHLSRRSTDTAKSIGLIWSFNSWKRAPGA